MEHQLGSETHDGPVRGGQHNIRVPVGRLQGDPRVYRRLHIPVDAVQGGEPDAQRGAVPQAHRRLVVSGARRQRELGARPGIIRAYGPRRPSSALCVHVYAPL